MSSFTVTASTLVSAPLERVFEVYTDLEKWPQRIPSIISIDLLPEGPIGEGARFIETRLILPLPKPGRRMDVRIARAVGVSEMCCTSFDALNSYTIEGESYGMHFSMVYEFTPEGEGVRVTSCMTTTALTWWTKIKLPFVKIGTRMMGVERRMLYDLELLRDACEHIATPAPA